MKGKKNKVQGSELKVQGSMLRVLELQSYNVTGLQGAERSR